MDFKRLLSEQRLDRVLILLVAALLVVFGAALITILTHPYLPMSSDAIYYYLGSKSVYLNHTLATPLLNEENQSLVGHFSSHGPVPFLFYGLAMMLTGGWPQTMILVHFLLLFVGPALLWRSKWTNRQKGLFSLVILSYFGTLLFAVQYMTEALHLFFAIPLTLLFVDLYRREPTRTDVIRFCLLLFVAALFRSLWAFWAFGLLGLAQNKPQFWGYLAVALGFVGFFTLFLKLFCAPFPDNMLSIYGHYFQAHQYSHLWNEIAWNFATNIDTVTRIMPGTGWVDLYMIFFVLLTFVFLLDGYFNRERLSLMTGCIGVCTMFILFLIYSAGEWKAHRMTAPTYYLYFALLVLKPYRKLLMTYGVITLLCLPTVIPLIFTGPYSMGAHLRWGQKVMSAAPTVQQQVQPLRQLPDTPAEGLVIDLDNRILFNHADWLLLLPLQTDRRIPLRYTLSIDDNGVLYGKVPVAYVLMRKDNLASLSAESLGHLKLQHCGPTLCLYKVSGR